MLQTMRVRAVVGAVVTAVVMVLTIAGTTPSALAHDDIASSVPADRSVLDEPISFATIDFGVDISESVELFLTYDPGGDADIVDVGGETTKTGATTARVDFEELTEEGTYFLQYLAPVPADGHVLVGAISFSYGTVTAIDEGNNDDIRSSTPSTREQLSEPITSAEIEFDLEITDDVTLALVYDRGDGENFDELGGVTEKTGPRTATLTFDELDREGTYFVLYDTTAVLTGGEIVGAIGFFYGDPSSTDSGFPIVAFLAAAIPILAIGAYFTWRGMRGPPDDEPTADPDDGRSDADQAPPSTEPVPSA